MPPIQRRMLTALPLNAEINPIGVQGLAVAYPAGCGGEVRVVVRIVMSRQLGRESAGEVATVFAVEREGVIF